MKENFVMNAQTAATLASPVTDTVHLREFYPDAGDITIERPSDLFLPDIWTKVFARGLRRAANIYNDVANSRILEVGVGTGVNMAGMLTIPCPPRDFIGTDICNNAVSASGRLARDNGWNVRLIASDLLDQVPQDLLNDVTHIVACIPQVPATQTLDITQGDNFAHYYEPTGTNWDEHGLGLNAKLLEQAGKRAPRAAITLNLAGRPCIERLKNMFTHYSRSPEIVHEETVQQHAGTSLASLAAKEKAGHSPFEFFADPAGAHVLSATQAESRRVVGTTIYHKVYVVTAKPLTV